MPRGKQPRFTDRKHVLARARSARYDEAHRSERNAAARRNNARPERVAARRRHGQKLKLEVVHAYSPGHRCQCEEVACWHEGACPVVDLRALSVDHKNGGGRKETAITGGGVHLYRSLILRGFPPGYQILCLNCQFVKRDVRREYSGVRRE